MTTMLTIKNSSIVLTSTCLRQSDGDQTRKMSNVWERIWEIHFFASPGKEERYSCVFWLKWRQPLEQTKSFENNCGRFEQSWKMSLPQSNVSNLLFQYLESGVGTDTQSQNFSLKAEVWRYNFYSELNRKEFSFRLLWEMFETELILNIIIVLRR